MTNFLDTTTYNSSVMQQFHKNLFPFVHSAAPLFFYGETGTGMSFYARAVHEASDRTGKFVIIPVFSLDEETVKQQFLGVEDRSGWLEEAHNGTIFLKRVAEASREIQKTLFHLLATQVNDGIIEFSRKGRTETLQVDVRFIFSAAVDDLDLAVEDGRLRQDLVDEIKNFGEAFRLPPLRGRKEDISIIAEYLIFKELNEKYHQQVSSIDKEACKLLTDYGWPGNVGELRQVLVNILSQYPGITTITKEHIPAYIANLEITGEYTFKLRDGERFKGKILPSSSSLRVQRDKSKFKIEMKDVVEIARVEDDRFAPSKLKHFAFKLKDGSQIAAMILDKTINVATSFDKSHHIDVVQDLQSVVIS